MIREFEKIDLEEVAKIWIDTNMKAHDFIPSQYWQNNFQMVKEMFLQAEIYVYEDTGRIQGFVGMDGDYVEGIFVAWEAQSQGIGKRLLDFVKERKKSLRLSVYEKNERAVRFYQREGFVIREERLDESTGEKEYVMVW